jgi:hypothetical protein
MDPQVRRLALLVPAQRQDAGKQCQGTILDASFPPQSGTEPLFITRKGQHFPLGWNEPELTANAQETG